MVLVTGMTSLALVHLTTMFNYLLKTATDVCKFKKKRVICLSGLVKLLTNLVGVLQVLLLVVLFIFSKVEFINQWSPFYVKKRIFMFSLVESLLMFISALVGATLMIILATHKPTEYLLGVKLGDKVDAQTHTYTCRQMFLTTKPR